MNALTASNNGYEQIKAILSQIRNNLKNIENVEEIQHKTFYINGLNDFSYNSYLKSKSTELSFEDVYKLLGK